MKALVHEKAQAIVLRKKGYSYKEILAVLPVAKSSLSLWLKDTPLTSSEKRVLKKRVDKNISHGRVKAAAAHRLNRLARESSMLPVIRFEFEQFKNEPLFHLGVGLYWAEGAKNSGGVMFTNSDVAMVQVMLLWLKRYAGYDSASLRYRLYIHKPYAHENCEGWWAKSLHVPQSTFTKTTYKPSNKGVKKRINYMGCLRIEVPKSSHLLQRLKIWTNLLVEYHQK